MTAGTARLRRDRVLLACSQQPGAWEDHPFGEGVVVFKVAARMFALVTTGDVPGRVTLKAEPADAARLVRRHTAATPGHHMNKEHWVTVVLDGTLPEQLLTELVEDSYDLVVAGLPARARPAGPVSSATSVRGRVTRPARSPVDRRAGAPPPGAAPDG